MEKEINTYQISPKNCNESYCDEMCDNCEFKNYECVSHPGGDSTSQIEKYFCELGYWEDNF